MMRRLRGYRWIVVVPALVLAACSSRLSMPEWEAEWNGVTGAIPLLDTVLTAALVPAEARQATSGGSNPRFAAAFGGGPAAPVEPGGRCAVVVHDPTLARAVVDALTARGARCEVLDPAPFAQIELRVGHFHLLAFQQDRGFVATQFRMCPAVNSR